MAYLTAQITLTLAGFKPGMTVLAPGIGGSVGKRPISSRGRGAPARWSRRPAARRKQPGIQRFFVSLAWI
jgi:hypothetical protein